MTGSNPHNAKKIHGQEPREQKCPDGIFSLPPVNHSNSSQSISELRYAEEGRHTCLASCVAEEACVCPLVSCMVGGGNMSEKQCNCKLGFSQCNSIYNIVWL